MKYFNNALIILGNVISRVGTGIYQVSLNFWIISTTGSTALLGLINAISFLPNLVLNLFSGYIADSFNRKKVIISADLICGFASILFAIILDQWLYIIIILNLIIAVTSTVFSTSFKAIIPDVLKKETIQTTNAILTNLSEVFKIVIPAIGVYLMSSNIISFASILVINGISFLLSALIAMFLTYHYQPSQKQKFSLYSVTNKIADGVKYILKHKDIYYIITFASLSNFFLAGYFIALPYYTIEIIQQGYLYGVINGVQAFGSIIAGLILIFYKKNTISLFYLKFFIILQSLALLTYTFGSFLWLGVFIFGLAGTFFNVIFFTYIQLNCDKEYLGRVFSVIYTFAGILIPVGAFFWGYILHHLGSYSFIILSLGLLFSSIRLLMLNNKVAI